MCQAYMNMKTFLALWQGIYYVNHIFCKTHNKCISFFFITLKMDYNLTASKKNSDFQAAS